MNTKLIALIISVILLITIVASYLARDRGVQAAINSDSVVNYANYSYILCVAGGDAKRVSELLSKLGVKHIFKQRISELFTEKCDAIILMEENSIDNTQTLLNYLYKGKVLILSNVSYAKIINMIKNNITMYVFIHDIPIYTLKLLGYEPKLQRYIVAIYGLASKNMLKDLDISDVKELLNIVNKMYEYRVEKIKRSSSTPIEPSNVNIKIKASSTPPGVKVYNVQFTTQYDPEWVTIGRISVTSGDSWKPYGKLNIEHEVKLLVGDGDPNMDTIIVKAVTEGVPGKVAYNEYSYLKDFWNYYYLKYYTNIYELRDYQPSSMKQPTGSISITLGTGGISISWTYTGPINYIKRIDCYSDMHLDRAAWWHDIDSASVVVKIEPGFLFTISPQQTGMQRWEIGAQFFRYTWYSLFLGPEKFIGWFQIDVVFPYG